MSQALSPPSNLNRLVYFASVVETGSFTRAAERLGITKAVVSQQIARLEREIGHTLLLRTTRKVTPTDAGRMLHARCLVIFKESTEAFDELAEGATEPRGTLRVTAPFDYGTAVVVPAATRFLQTYPACEVALQLRDDQIDLMTVDLAIRVGWIPDSSHIVRRIGVMEQYLVASPELAKRRASIRDPEDVAALPFILNTRLPEPDRLRFAHARRGQRTIRVRPRMTVDTTPAAHAAVLADAGISVLPDYLVAADLAAGRLVRLLPTWHLPRGGIHILLPSSRFRPAKVARFVEAITLAQATVSAPHV